MRIHHEVYINLVNAHEQRLIGNISKSKVAGYSHNDEKFKLAAKLNLISKKIKLKDVCVSLSRQREIPSVMEQSILAWN